MTCLCEFCEFSYLVRSATLALVVGVSASPMYCYSDNIYQCRSAKADGVRFVDFQWVSMVDES